MNHRRIERKFRPQLHYALMILVWLLVIGSCLLYVCFVLADIWRPHVAWWLVSSGLVIAAVVFAAFLVMRRFWHGSRRTWSIAIFMFTATPLVLFASFVWLIIGLAQERGDMQLSMPVRAFGIWVGDYFELESRWRHPRITEGKHVQLFDSGNTPDVENLVVEMDAHIERMARVLETPVSDWNVAWVRGALFGQTGRAVGLWAICKVDGDPGKLEFLDKHEVAHTAITSMCNITQDPPMLLAEGWAQSQSVPRDDLINSLQKQRSMGVKLSLMELVSDRFYGRSIGPAYSIGGPLAVYLLERFGGKTFLELYGSVRRPTFLTDAQRILGVSWNQIDTDFWEWLAVESESIRSQEADDHQLITFANLEDQPLWQRILDGCRDFESKFPRPKNLAFKMVYENEYTPLQVLAVLGENQAWIINEHLDNQFPNEFILHRPGQNYFFEQSDGDIRYSSLESRYSEYSDYDMGYILRTTRDLIRMNSLRQMFIFDVVDPPSQKTNMGIHILDITPGETESLPWRLTVSEIFDSSQQPLYVVELMLDPENGFSVIESLTHSDHESLRDVPDEEKIIGVKVLYESGMFLGQATAISSTSIKMDDTSKTSSWSIQELDQESVEAVKARVEAIVAKGPTAKPVEWKKLVVNPYCLAFGWPILASIVLGIDMIGERVKIRVPPGETTVTESE